MAEWRDLLDPGRDELLANVGDLLPDVLVEQLAAEPDPGRRPRLTGGSGWIAGMLQVPVLVEVEDRLYYQEVGLVLTSERAVTVRWTPSGEEPFDPAAVRELFAEHPSPSPGRIAYQLLDEVADRHLDLEDSLNTELDELDEHVDDWPSERIRRRITDLRHDILQIRRTLGPTRDAVRRLVDGRLDIGSEPVVGEELRPLFAQAYDKLLHATEALDLARDLLSGVRESHQARIAQEQNDVIKKLAVIASLLLLPTFIVGNYGQNFDHMPELEWRLGYLFSWGLVVATTVAQLAFYRWRRWI
jgi:magnesium transporter